MRLIKGGEDSGIKNVGAILVIALIKANTSPCWGWGEYKIRPYK